jgi:hypothetical protein
LFLSLSTIHSLADTKEKEPSFPETRGAFNFIRKGGREEEKKRKRGCYN